MSGKATAAHAGERGRPYERLSASLESRREQRDKQHQPGADLKGRLHDRLGTHRGRAIAAGIVIAIVLALVAAGIVFREEIASHFEMESAGARMELLQAQQERDSIARELDTAWGALKAQSAELGEHAVLNQELLDMRGALQRTEALTDTYRTMLQQERARVAKLNEQLEERAAAQAVAGRAALAAALADRAALEKHLSELQQELRQKEEQLGAVEILLETERIRSQEPEKAPAPEPTIVQGEPEAGLDMGAAADAAPAEPIEKPIEKTIEYPIEQPVEKPIEKAPGPPIAREATVNPDAARLLSRALVLREKGDIAGARAMFERAGEMGSAEAVFALAETYDPALLLAWKTVGTRGDVGTARVLYTQALAGGVRQAADRLDALR